MHTAALLLACALAAPRRAAAAPAADRVASLPGFGAPLSPFYSGYLAAGPGQRLHYVYSAAIGADPASAPLVLWSNGGPGCSSMEGAFSESGPYHVQQFTSPPTLELNPYTWNNETNNLFIESPAGVGFSYCEEISGCDHTDTTTAANSLLALRSFFAAFPELQKNAFWLTGESYAGIVGSADNRDPALITQPDHYRRRSPDLRAYSTFPCWQPQCTTTTRADLRCPSTSRYSRWTGRTTHFSLLLHLLSNFPAVHPTPPHTITHTTSTAQQGIMVGNGCIGNVAGHCGSDPINDLHDVQTFRGHGLISDKLYTAIIADCNCMFHRERDQTPDHFPQATYPKPQTLRQLRPPYTPHSHLALAGLRCTARRRRAPDAGRRHIRPLQPMPGSCHPSAPAPARPSGRAQHARPPPRASGGAGRRRRRDARRQRR